MIGLLKLWWKRVTCQHKYELGIWEFSHREESIWSEGVSIEIEYTNVYERNDVCSICHNVAVRRKKIEA